MQNITKLTQTVDDLSATDCGATFLARPVYFHSFYCTINVTEKKSRF